MLSKNRLKNFFALSVLLCTGWLSLATSYSMKELPSGAYLVRSDCVTPAIEQQVVVLARQIIEPSGVSFTDFGFPSTTVDSRAPISGMINGVQRDCTLAIGEQTIEPDGVFACFDNGEFACNIHLHR